MKSFRWLGWLGLVPVVLLSAAWTFGALYFDGPSKVLAFAFAAAVAAIFVFVRSLLPKLIAFGALFALILAWWLSLKPTNTADWQPDVARLGRAEINGDEVTVYNVRNCDYRTETDYTPRWETRKVYLSKLTGIDIAVCNWGSPWMAHPIVSFQFSDAPPLAFSIETRKKVGQSYSAIGGLYRQFELIYIVSDERDVIRLRTNYRTDETVCLYRIRVSSAKARERFLEYIGMLNQLDSNPRWYNAITTNCTTSIRSQHQASERLPWDWRILANGKGDELMYERNQILTDGLSFADLKKRSLINPVAKPANDSPSFSTLIRANLPFLVK